MGKQVFNGEQMPPPLKLLSQLSNTHFILAMESLDMDFSLQWKLASHKHKH